MRRLPALSEPQVKLDQPPAIAKKISKSDKTSTRYSGDFRNKRKMMQTPQPQQQQQTATLSAPTKTTAEKEDDTDSTATVTTAAASSFCASEWDTR